MIKEQACYDQINYELIYMKLKILYFCFKLRNSMNTENVHMFFRGYQTILKKRKEKEILKQHEQIRKRHEDIKNLRKKRNIGDGDITSK